jgi:hypothetical protein
MGRVRAPFFARLLRAMALGTGQDVLHSKDQPRYAIMHRDVQQGVLRKRLAILHSFLMLGKSEWSLRLKFTVTGEIRRIQEQMELQNMARCRVLTSSFNINSLSDEECLIKFRFMRKDVGFISELIPWDQCLDEYGRMRTARRRYQIDPMEATAIFCVDCRLLPVGLMFRKNSGSTLLA